MFAATFADAKALYVDNKCLQKMLKNNSRQMHEMAV
jgi:hypothetical protein